MKPVLNLVETVAVTPAGLLSSLLVHGWLRIPVLLCCDGLSVTVRLLIHQIQPCLAFAAMLVVSMVRLLVVVAVCPALEWSVVVLAVVVVVHLVAAVA
jgi:hypothetical protein